MFQIQPRFIKRVSFATKIFPKLKSSLGLDINKLKSTDKFDGELFCGGRSRNKDLLTFFGFINESANGCASFAQLPGFRRSLKKLIELVELELENAGSQEVLLPTLVPQKLWQTSKRSERQHNALDSVYTLTDNNGTKLILGPTFEESITQLVSEADQINEAELPLLLYQTSTKFRYEPNPRFGLLRSNEFMMNDLYSFDANLEKAAQTYDSISNVYKRIFSKLGLNCYKIEGGTGNIGGKYSHEYQLPISSGEDKIVKCNSCQHAFNAELDIGKNSDVNTCIICGSNDTSQSRALELGHTFLLSDLYSKPLQAKFTAQEGNDRLHYEMGCYGLGLSRILGAGVDLFSIVPTRETADSQLQLRWPNQVEPYSIGVVGPAKRSKQYHEGSSNFIENMVNKILCSTRKTDILVEDRDKEGIGRRVFRLKSLGLPHILVVGQRFLQDEPEVELLKLDAQKVDYEQLWLSEDQLIDYLRKLDD